MTSLQMVKLKETFLMDYMKKLEAPFPWKLNKYVTQLNPSHGNRRTLPRGQHSSHLGQKVEFPFREKNVMLEPTNTITHSCHEVT